MTAQTQSLAAWLLERIAEDEALAQAASPGSWHTNAESDEVLAADDITVCDGFALSGPQTRATTAHIARHDPARVLAECEAKRRIVELHQPFEAYRDKPLACMICVQTDDCGGYVELDESPYPCETIRALAAPYAGAEGWQGEWRA